MTLGQQTQEVRHAFRLFLLRARQLPRSQIAFITFLIVLLTAGNALQIIGLNFWLRHFDGHHYGPFTTMTVSGLFFALFFLIMMGIHIARLRRAAKPGTPLSAHFRFIWNRRSLFLLNAIGFGDAVNSAMAIYATKGTPEVLQALFMSLQSMFTFGFSKLLLNDPRNYCHLYPMIAFALMLGGVVVASISDFTDSSGASGDKKWWSLIFFMSVPIMSMYNVIQQKYMDDFTDPNLAHGEVFNSARHIVSSVESPTAVKSPLMLSTPLGMTSPGGTFSEASAGPPSPIAGLPKGDDATVKFVMLLGDTTIQELYLLMMLPMDALPWYGKSATVADAASNFESGLQCLFNCDQNWVYGLLYSSGFVFQYIGSAYLNHYSATLCSMIGQLSSPVTALILILIPSWNLNQGSSPWYLSVAAIIVLTIGTILYSIWEEITKIETDVTRAIETPVIGDNPDEKPSS